MVKIARVVAVMTITVVPCLSAPAPALGQEADLHASCTGIVSSRINAGERDYIAHLTKSTTAPTLGFQSPGAYTSYFSQLSGTEIGAECS